MRSLVRVVGAIGCMAALSACATVTRGSHEAWQVNSTPAGAHVKTSLGGECTTPCAMKIKRKAKFTADISKDGYETVHVTVIHETAGAGAAGMAGNVLVGGLIGVVVDANTGATQRLTPNPVNVTLQPLKVPASNTASN